MPGPDAAGAPLPVGSPAPDFELDATGGRRIRLASLLAAGPVALFFYPGNDTPG
jgi:peroxiredoxin Q/BCP